MTTALGQLILKRGLVGAEGDQNNVSYQGIEIEAGWIWDVGQPDILVSLGPPLKNGSVT